MTDRAIAIIQARMGSSRLPGKVLRTLAGRPVILHIVERLRRVRGLDGIVIATTAAPEDQPLVDLLRDNGVDVYAHAGDPNDLLGRYISAGRLHRADIILMVCSDCPLLDPDTASRMIDRLRSSQEHEYVRIDPPGVEGGVACLRLSTYERIDEGGAQGPYREHSTLRILKHPEEFRIADIQCDPAFADPTDAHRFWLDTEADLRFLQTVYERLYRPGEIVDLREVIRLLRREPQLRGINAHVQQKNPVKDPNVGSAMVALALPAGGAHASFFAELAAHLAETHHVGVRRIEPTEAPEALDSRILLVVVARGDVRPRGDGVRTCEIDASSSPAQAARTVSEAIASTRS